MWTDTGVGIKIGSTCYKGGTSTCKVFSSSPSISPKPSRVIHVSGKELEKISYNCLISTNKGILTKEEAIRNNTGGIILIKYEVGES